MIETRKAQTGHVTTVGEYTDEGIISLLTQEWNGATWAAPLGSPEVEPPESRAWTRLPTEWTLL